jgi:hypothetical protein
VITGAVLVTAITKLNAPIASSLAAFRRRPSVLLATSRPAGIRNPSHDRPIETSPCPLYGPQRSQYPDVRSEPNFGRGETRLRKAELSQELTSNAEGDKIPVRALGGC